MNTIPIIYQNEEIVIINKPQGIAVQGGQNIVHSIDKELPLQLGFPIYLVHRLDQETSGLLLVAKTPFYANKWTKLICEKSVKKEYDAICIGCPKQLKGELKTTIEDHGVKKSALTFYQVIKSWTVDCKTSTTQDSETQIQKVVLSHIHLTLSTGRMHQIRIHLSKAGYPIAADDKYGNFKINKLLKKNTNIKRLQLVSSKLTIPIDNKKVEFSINLENITQFQANLN